MKKGGNSQTIATKGVFWLILVLFDISNKFLIDEGIYEKKGVTPKKIATEGLFFFFWLILVLFDIRNDILKILWNLTTGEWFYKMAAKMTTKTLEMAIIHLSLTPAL